jgi:hypothetical protein
MWPWIVGIIAVIVVVMLVYGYERPIPTTASTPPSSSSPTTTGCRAGDPCEGKSLAATPPPAPSIPALDNR